jgi:hypothetical protein
MLLPRRTPQHGLPDTAPTPGVDYAYVIEPTGCRSLPASTGAESWLPNRRRCTRPDGTRAACLPPHQAWSTFGPHAIGTERFPAVSSATSFVQVAGAILQKRARAQNPEDELRARRVRKLRHGL